MSDLPTIVELRKTCDDERCIPWCQEPSVAEWKDYGMRSGWLKEAGSMVVGSWVCRTCGTEHGEAGCGNYDVDRASLWVVSDG